MATAPPSTASASALPLALARWSWPSALERSGYFGVHLISKVTRAVGRVEIICRPGLGEFTHHPGSRRWRAIAPVGATGRYPRVRSWHGARILV